MLKVNSIELTNICNLRCSHCPVGTEVKPVKGRLKVLNDGVSYHKGYISMDHFIRAMAFTGEWVNLQAHGEALLHPQLLEFLALIKAMGKKSIVNSNGVIVTREMGEAMFEAGLNSIEVSIHVKKSLEAFKHLMDANNEKGYGAIVVANILTCYADDLKGWIKDVGITAFHLEKMRLVNVHNWAMEKPSPERGKEYASKCFYINNNECVVKWDGKVVSCCFDFEGINAVGHVNEMEQLQHKSDYKLCESCSPAWVNYGGEFGGYGLAPEQWLS